MFQKARQNRIFQDMVEQIQEAILQGTLNPGDKLPPERELKEVFEASRGTLREALRILEQKGLITIKTGVAGGAVVNALTTDQVSESLDLLIRYQKGLFKGSGRVSGGGGGAGCRPCCGEGKKRRHLTIGGDSCRGKDPSRARNLSLG